MRQNNAQFRRGFSLLEMTVVLGIVAIMTAISLWEMPKLKGGLSIDIVAQELAIYVRGAQVYSRATKIAREQVANQRPEDFNYYHSFGVHFTKGQGQFFLWTDLEDRTQRKDEPDFSYYATNNPPEETYELPKGYAVTGLYSDGNCGGAAQSDQYGVMDVVFKRPDPEANFACSDPKTECPSVEGKPDICGSGSTAWIEITSPNDAQKRYIRVSNNGQILVQKVMQ
ncbi:MAG: prepilin-type N-terminal cleavage/methylation domain-containing protein [Candidatus Vogelbacteria bacterium]|nr:prepilin-type N-terminal cleavage/methylation domain-containing protein [Candidatus Vogelbacteria bacterium]